MRRLIPALLCLAVAACADETLSGYADPDAVWQLVALDGAPFPARATIRFPKKGEITGEAPCNGFAGAQTEPYPWFKAEHIAATMRACPDLEAEGLFLARLAEMSLAEVAGDTLLLTDDRGGMMVFRRAE